MAAEVLFFKEVPVNIKTSVTGGQSSLTASSSSSSAITGIVSNSATSALQQESRRHAIHVHVAVSTPQQAGRVKVLELRLTDETDSFFLYQLSIGEDDFHVLRSEQNLLVDFNQFPHKFIELLEECIRCRSDESPKFLAQMSLGANSQSALFNIIETNTFKHIIHLSLHFIPGNDAAVKQYLAGMVKELKTDNSVLRNQLRSTHDSLSTRLRDTAATSAAVVSELDKLKISHAEQASRLQLQHSQQMAEEKERALREKEELRSSYEKEMKDMMRNYEDQIKNLSQQQGNLQSSQTHLSTKCGSLESSLQAEIKKSDRLAFELSASKQENENLRASQQNLIHAKSDLEKEVRRLDERCAQLAQHNQMLDEDVKRMETTLAEANAQREKMEETVEIFKLQNGRLDEGLKKATDEISKGNDIIRRLQADLKAAKSKIKLKNVVTLQQEKLLDERANLMDLQQKDLSALQESYAKKEAEVEELRVKCEELASKLEDSKKIISDNTHVIEWLHKQLNEEALNRAPLLGSSSIIPSYTRLDLDRDRLGTATSIGLNKENNVSF
ncbi:Spindle assembly abnormal protein 6 [Blyttiomyces sp. JEL0837]|nr:Spindle assembly abnormal protein 6 [Blyttiomyces sp. JEL0837]